MRSFGSSIPRYSACSSGSASAYLFCPVRHAPVARNRKVADTHFKAGPIHITFRDSTGPLSAERLLQRARAGSVQLNLLRDRGIQRGPDKDLTLPPACEGNRLRPEQNGLANIEVATAKVVGREMPSRLRTFIRITSRTAWRTRSDRVRPARKGVRLSTIVRFVAPSFNPGVPARAAEEI